MIENVKKMTLYELAADVGERVTKVHSRRGKDGLETCATYRGKVEKLSDIRKDLENKYLARVIRTSGLRREPPYEIGKEVGELPARAKSLVKPVVVKARKEYRAVMVCGMSGGGGCFTSCEWRKTYGQAVTDFVERRELQSGYSDAVKLIEVREVHEIKPKRKEHK